jgi:hypothetical protein
VSFFTQQGFYSDIDRALRSNGRASLRATANTAEPTIISGPFASASTK